MANVVTLSCGQQYEEHAPGCWQAVKPSLAGAWPGCMSLQSLVDEIERMTYLHTRILRSGPTRAERKRAKKVAA